ncbi:MAG: 2-oxoglutarate dehydrogenase, E2 component, dihydrolipoamide succinyltransferase [Ornithinimicrobium sp.]
MSERVSMPALGESVTEGTVTRWLKSVGDEVEVDEPLLEVSTDKVDTEIPSPVAGTLQEILAEEDETVEVGADLAVIGDGSDGDSSGGDEQDTSGSDDDESATDSDGDGAEAADDDSAEDSAEKDSAEKDSADESDGDGDAAAQSDGAEDSGQDSTGSSDSESGDGETVTMPALGESVTEGTVTRWLKQEGDDVEVDEPLLEVSTDKVDTEIPSPVAGKLTKILVDEDATVEVGGDLAVIGGGGGGSDSDSDSDSDSESASGDSESGDSSDSDSSDSDTQDESDDDDDLASEQKLHEESDEESATSDGDGAGSDSDSDSGSQKREASGSAQDSGGEGSTPGASEEKSSAGPAASSDAGSYVTPLVRKLAAKHDVDLDSLEGTGVGGRIRKQDVLEAAKAADEAPAESASASSEAPQEDAAPSSTGGEAPSEEAAAKRGTTEKMSRLRKVIATRMVESLQVSAQLTTVVEVDVTKVARLRASVKDDFAAREGVKLSFMPFFALAAVEALKQHPHVNSSIDDDQIVYHPHENLGIAVDTEKGLIVPVIKEAGDLNIAGLARKIADLAERTRTNKIGPEELGGGTFTLTNTGSRGALFDTPILNQPQVGILGTGAVVRRPVVVQDADGGESIAVRSMVYLALTYDHRIVDGADAARFLSTMKARLEEAAFEV